MKTNKLTTKRFVIRKSLLDTNTVITFTNSNTVPKFCRDLAEITEK